MALSVNAEKHVGSSKKSIQLLLYIFFNVYVPFIISVNIKHWMHFKMVLLYSLCLEMYV